MTTILPSGLRQLQYPKLDYHQEYDQDYDNSPKLPLPKLRSGLRQLNYPNDYHTIRTTTTKP